MSGNTMSFALPSRYAPTSTNVSSPASTATPASTCVISFCRDQDDQAKKRLRELMTAGLESGPGRPLTRRVAAELRDRALGTPT